MNRKQPALHDDKEANKSERIADSIKFLVDSSCARKVVSLQTAIKDKKVIISSDGFAAAAADGSTSGCNYASSKFTVEAFDHERKMRLHGQLKLARKLRCQMENAVSEAKKAGNCHDAKAIFLERREDMLELASLTNAVLGGYTLESYREYIDLEKDREERDKQCFEHSQGELNKLRERMLWESSPQTFVQQNNRNRRRRSASTEPTSSSQNQPISSSTKMKINRPLHSLMETKSSKKKFSPEQRAQIHVKSKLYNNHIKKNSPEKNFNLSNNGNTKKKSPEKKKEIKQKSFPTTQIKKPITPTTTGVLRKHYGSSAKRQIDTKLLRRPEKQKESNIRHSLHENANSDSAVKTTSPSSKNSSLTKQTKTSEVISHETKPPTTCKVATSTNPSRTNRHQSTTTITKNPKKAPKSKLKRKCHYCKETIMEYSVCNYWFINGNKCKKIFCKSCLGRFNETSSDASDWHCPSCTNKCDCPVCVKDREREEMRANKRRRTARTDFSIFN